MEEIVKLIREELKEDMGRIEKKVDKLDDRLDNLFYYKAKIIGAASVVAAALNMVLYFGIKHLGM